MSKKNLDRSSADIGIGTEKSLQALKKKTISMKLKVKIKIKIN